LIQENPVVFFEQVQFGTLSETYLRRSSLETTKLPDSRSHEYLFARCGIQEREGERKITHGIRILTLSFYHSAICFCFRRYLPRTEIILQSSPRFRHVQFNARTDGQGLSRKAIPVAGNENSSSIGMLFLRLSVGLLEENEEELFARLSYRPRTNQRARSLPTRCNTRVVVRRGTSTMPVEEGGCSRRTTRLDRI